jgi:hypothetical protein
LLAAWFVRRLAKQVVVDLVHLQMLLDGFVELYQKHWHRQLRSTPREALADRVSPRSVSGARLEDAFRQEKKLRTHRKTGEVDVGAGTWTVPEHLRGQKLVFRIDLDPQVPPLVVEPGTGRLLPLVRAAVRPEDAAPEPPRRRWGKGLLQQLYDAWQGKVRPVAEPGFGLPEVFEILSQLSGRHVPRTDADAALVQRLWREIGPLARIPTEKAFREIEHSLGPGRALETYLDALRKRVVPVGEALKKKPRKKCGGKP